MTLFKATQRAVRIEERYVEADSKEEALHFIDYEDAGADNAHFRDESSEEWRIEEEQ
ncbi:hypothetical protein [Staphylococcus pasteuri]|uniref:hypothetical protein n=1 Tax=Staphylococcus pasteuri TaxID=45972 RepID=UPI0015E6B8F4|nr:hypothetical protein [Staphylococcus pasteuri]MBM6506808.1 hypothetical protein [Staphylococcus pasteuri]QQT21426.1 hypothetical protein I6J08_05805 [Staphylococcus pasteuri]